MTAEKAPAQMTCTKDDTIHDGEGGFIAKGAKFTPADEDAAADLKDRGFAR